jgi:hypothetical protein
LSFFPNSPSSKRERQFGQWNGLAGQTLIGFSFLSAKTRDTAMDDAHGAAFALADPAPARKRKTCRFGSIKDGAELWSPDKAPVAAGDMDGL